MVGGSVKSVAAFSTQGTGEVCVAARNTSHSGVNGCGLNNIAHPNERLVANEQTRGRSRNRKGTKRKSGPANRRRHLEDARISRSKTRPRSRLEPKRAETTTRRA